MTTNDSFFVRFWGVRGSAPRPGMAMARYGGNTACLEMRMGGRILIFDAGTGLHDLAGALRSEGVQDVDLYLTHTHIDHVLGFPGFATSQPEHATCRISAGHFPAGLSIGAALADLMRPPIFPVPLEDCPGSFDFHAFRAGATLTPYPGVVIRTAPLNHPGGSTGFRVEYGGRSICYVTDTEHVPGLPDRNILRLIDKADVMIYDATFTDAEFASRRGWGHSTWEEGARLCDEASVDTYVVFHHSPDRDDAAMDAIARAVQARRVGSVVAREGLVLYP